MTRAAASSCPISPESPLRGLAFSRDGQWVTYTSYPDGTLWRSKVDGSDRLQLTFPPLRVLLPRWSPDGKQIAFNARLHDAPFNIYVISSDGGQAQRILPSEQTEVDANWSPDGNSLIFGANADVRNKEPIRIIDIRSKRVVACRAPMNSFRHAGRRMESSLRP